MSARVPLMTSLLLLATHWLGSARADIVWEGRTVSAWPEGAYDEAVPLGGTEQALRVYPAPKGPVWGLTILIDFSDQAPAFSKTQIDAWLNQRNYTGGGSKGSVRDYFWEVSNGQVDFQNQVVGFYRAKKTKSYYEGGEGYARAGELVREVIAAIDPMVDFSRFDNDGNGSTDAVSLVYAGHEETWGQGLWPHAGGANVRADGVQVGRYMMSALNDTRSAPASHARLLHGRDLRDHVHRAPSGEGETMQTCMITGAYEAHVLEKPRIHQATMPGIASGHPLDQIALEPLERLVHRQAVDLGRVLAWVDGPSHQGQALGNGQPLGRHQRDRAQDRHAGLTNRDHMQSVGTEMRDEATDVVYVVVQREWSLAEGDQTSIDPVRDVDVMIGKKCPDGITEQGGVMSRERRDDQDFGAVLEGSNCALALAETLESEQPTEWLRQRDMLDDDDIFPTDLHRADVKLRLWVLLPDAIEQLPAGSHLRDTWHAFQPAGP